MALQFLYKVGKAFNTFSQRCAAICPILTYKHKHTGTDRQTDTTHSMSRKRRKVGEKNPELPFKTNRHIFAQDDRQMQM